MLENLPRRLRQSAPPGTDHIELHPDSALTAQDLVEILMAAEQSGLTLPGGVQIHVEVTDIAARGGV